MPTRIFPFYRDFQHNFLFRPGLCLSFSLTKDSRDAGLRATLGFQKDGLFVYKCYQKNYGSFSFSPNLFSPKGFVWKLSENLEFLMNNWNT